jgi:hypothetical protein
MKNQSNKMIMPILIGISLLLGACSGGGTPAAPTPDANAIATSAVQTVEARYTEQAMAAPTIASTPEPVSELPTSTPEPATPAPQAQPQTGGPACLYATFVADVTVQDGMVMAPGATFTKTWRIKNIGSCPWDSGYKLVFESGDAMTTTTSAALPKTVYPDETVDISVNMTAPTTDGVYTGKWRIATPYGGTFGVGLNDQSLTVMVTVAKKTELGFRVFDVQYVVTRDPQTGCPAKGAVYTITATVFANSAGEVLYHWDRNPSDQSKPESGKLVFSDAGSKVVSFVWTLKPDAVQGIDRWVALYIDSPNNEQFARTTFNFSCQ